MKKQKKKLTEKAFLKYTRRWEREEMLQLSHHFHKITTDGKQYSRTSNFEMNSEDVKDFEKLKHGIDLLEIYLGLKKGNKKKQTFFPILKVTDIDKGKHYFKLDPIDDSNENDELYEEVPGVFKDMVCKNWDEVDIHLIDDLFTARTKKKVGKRMVGTTERVLSYKVNDIMIKNVIQNLIGINGITLYSGIDMNKFSNKELISFTPVLGFKFEKRNKEKEAIGLKGVFEFAGGKEVFIEYTSPCPPTC